MTRSLMMSAEQLGLTAQDVADIAEWLASYK
jgi:cytochrome c553